MIEVLKVIGTMLNVSFESRGHSCCSLSCRLFLITNLMLEGQHSDPAAGWIEDKAELPGGDTNRRGEMYWYHTDSHYKWIKNKENKCDPTLEKKKCLFFFFWPQVLSDIRHLMKSTDKRCRAEYIFLAALKAASAFFFFFFRLSEEKGAATRRTETDSKGERRKVCLFFLPFVSFDNSDLLLSLARSLCRRLSASFLSLSSLSLWSNFTAERVPGGDSHSSFSLNYLPSVSHSANSRPKHLCLFRALFLSFSFVLIIPLSDPRHNCWFKSRMNNVNSVSIRSAGKYCIRCSLTASVSNRAPAEMWTRINSSYLTWKWS